MSRATFAAVVVLVSASIAQAGNMDTKPVRDLLGKSYSGSSKGGFLGLGQRTCSLKVTTDAVGSPLFIVSGPKGDVRVPTNSDSLVERTASRLTIRGGGDRTINSQITIELRNGAPVSVLPLSVHEPRSKSIVKVEPFASVRG